jgi:hypothetical protein
MSLGNRNSGTIDMSRYHFRNDSAVGLLQQNKFFVGALYMYVSSSTESHAAFLKFFVSTRPKRWHGRHLISLISLISVSITIAPLVFSRYPVHHGSFQRAGRAAHG